MASERPQGRDGDGARPPPDDLDLIATEAEPGRLAAYVSRVAGALDRLVSLWGTDDPRRGGVRGQ